MKYCPYCQQNVEPMMKMNLAVFIILLLCGIILGIVYFLYCHNRKVCPMCRASIKLLEEPRM